MPEVTLKQSVGILLHNAILSGNEESALRIIAELYKQASFKPHPYILVDGRPFYGENNSSAIINITPFKDTGMRVVRMNLPSPELWKQEILKQLDSASNPHPFEVNTYFQNALQLAADKGLARVVSRLLELGIEPNYRDGFGLTALHYAALKRNNSIIRLLLEHGADPNLTDPSLCPPFYCYLKSQEGHINDQVLKSLRIDYLAIHRQPSGKMKSELMCGMDRTSQKFTEKMAALRVEAESAVVEFAPECFKAISERREPDKAQEMNNTRKLLVVMIKILGTIRALPDSLILEKIRNTELLYALQFFGAQIVSLAKEAKCPYQDRIPWNNLEFLACLFKDGLPENFQIGLQKLIIQTFPIIQKDLIRMVREFDVWLEKNSSIIQCRPFRHVDLITLYNFTDYFHDRSSLSDIIKLLKVVESTDVKDEYGRRALLQILKVIGDLTKYQHQGRNLTRTVKQKVPEFPWNELGELRDKLAKTSLLQENVTFIEGLIKNDLQFFIDLQQELRSLSESLSSILRCLEYLQYSQLHDYYSGDEPSNKDQAGKDLRLIIPVSDYSIIKVISEIKAFKIQSLSRRAQQLEEQIKEMASKPNIPEQKKQKIQANREKVQREIEEIERPYNKIIAHCTHDNFITLNDLQFLFKALPKRRSEIKSVIARSSRFYKRILELEARLIFKKDDEFLELSAEMQIIIKQRIVNYLHALLDLIGIDKSRFQQIDSSIFQPGHDNFCRELLDGFARIADNHSKRYAVYYLCVEIQQSLRFTMIGGNPELRIHLDHDNRVFKAILPDRLREELSEMLHDLIEYLPRLENPATSPSVSSTGTGAAASSVVQSSTVPKVSTSFIFFAPQFFTATKGYTSSFDKLSSWLLCDSGGDVAEDMYGLKPYSVHYEPGDCLFAAIAAYIPTPPNNTAEAMRRLAVDLISHDDELRSQITALAGYRNTPIRIATGEDVIYHSLEEYIFLMGQNKTWGSAIEIFALSRMLNRTIVILNPHDRSIYIVDQPPTAEQNAPIFIRYQGNNHYVPYISPENPTELLETIRRDKSGVSPRV